MKHFFEMCEPAPVVGPLRIYVLFLQYLTPPQNIYKTKWSNLNEYAF